MRDERWRDDAWHEDGYDRDDAHPEVARQDLDARYGHPDPRENAWTWTDIGVGWVAGFVALLVVALAHGAWLGVVSGNALAIVGMPLAVAIGGGFVLALFGIPVAIVLAVALRPVRSEPAHLAAFLAAGLLGAGLLALVLGGLGLFLVIAPYAVAASVTGRYVAKRRAVRRDEQWSAPLPADPG